MSKFVLKTTFVKLQRNKIRVAEYYTVTRILLIFCIKFHIRKYALHSGIGEALIEKFIKG